MGDLHVMKSGLEEAGKGKVLAHHSGHLRGKRWNREQRGKVLGRLGKNRRGGSGGGVSEGGWRATLPA